MLGAFWRDSSNPANGHSTMAIDEMARDFASNSSGMMGEVMNLEDFLDELSEPDSKIVNNNETPNENTNRNNSQRYMFNPLANLEMMFNSSNYYQQQQIHQNPTLSTISKIHGKYGMSNRII